MEHWIVYEKWPKEFSEPAAAMNLDRGTSASRDSSSKRKSESTHRFEQAERLAANGIFMRSSALVQPSSKDLCNSFLTSGHMPVYWPSYPPEKFTTVLERVAGLNEPRIQRDVMPVVVPSAENLALCGEPVEPWIGDEVQAEWIRCRTLGSTKPKPDYTAGLLRKAFTTEENEKLQNYSSSSGSFQVTPELTFPFLMCEAKSGEEGLNKAHRQNIHSGSIAVKAIIDLYGAAFGDSNPDRVNELYGQILVFTVAHNHNTVYLYGHYAVLADGSFDKLEYYRHEIAIFSLTIDDGRDRFRTYNFVRDVYEKFAPAHRKRIMDAVASLDASGQRLGSSFAVPDLNLDGDSQGEAAFLVPGQPASALFRAQMNQQKQVYEKQQKETDELRNQVNMLLQQQQEQQRQQQEQQRQQKEQMDQLLSLLRNKP